MTHKIAFITGITGQDGAYLADLLLDKGYAVHGLVRWDCVDGMARLQDMKLVERGLHLHYGDMADANSLNHLIKIIRPDEIYNLAALSHVKVSFSTPCATLDVNTGGTLNMFEAVRLSGLEHKTRMYQASSSEMFGASPAPQSEDTPMLPCSPYGVSKLASYHMARVYRASYNMFITNGILFNHESPLRGEDFVTRKITRAVTAMADNFHSGQDFDVLTLGNLDAKRDWGHARDYVRGIWMMMQHDAPDDFVLATGKAYSVRHFVERVFGYVGINVSWRGAGVNEEGYCRQSGRVLVRVDASLFRPKEVHHLLGDAAKAKAVLGWHPLHALDDLITDMMRADRADFLRVRTVSDAAQENHRGDVRRKNAG